MRELQCQPHPDISGVRVSFFIFAIMPSGSVTGPLRHEDEARAVVVVMSDSRGCNAISLVLLASTICKSRQWRHPRLAYAHFVLRASKYKVMRTPYNVMQITLDSLDCLSRCGFNDVTTQLLI